MAESTTLAEAVDKAVLDFFAKNGGGFPVAYVFALDFVNPEGKAALVVCEQDSQPTHRSLGLAAYLDTWYRDDAQRLWFTEIEGEGE